jgi:hypothetical protein
VAGRCYIEWHLPLGEAVSRSGNFDLQIIWTGDDSRIICEIFDHHRSLLQCCSSSVVQDGDHDLRISREIFLSLQGRSRWLRG